MMRLNESTRDGHDAGGVKSGRTLTDTFFSWFSRCDGTQGLRHAEKMNKTQGEARSHRTEKIGDRKEEQEDMNFKIKQEAACKSLNQDMFLR